jgi:HlyD family secretion protein
MTASLFRKLEKTSVPRYHEDMKRHFLFLVIALALFVSIGAVFVFVRQRQESNTDALNPNTPETAAKKSDGSLQINNAKIVPEEEFTLSFTLPGKIDKIFSQEGSVLEKDEAILKLDTNSLESQRGQAEAAVTQAKNELAKAKIGTRPEELLIFQKQTLAATTSFKNARQGTIDALRSTFEASDDAIRNTADRLFLGGDTISPVLRFTPHESSSSVSLISDRKEIERLLDDWKDDVDSLGNMDTNEIKSAILKYKKRLRSVRNFLDDLSSATNSLSSADGIDATTLDAWKGGLSTARLQVAERSSSLTGTESAYRDAAKNTSISESTFDLYQAGSRIQDIAIAQAALDAAVQSLAQADDAIEKATLRCPKDGLVITKIYPNQSESLPAYQPAVILSTKSIRVDTDVPEEYLGDVPTGKSVSFRFDAFPDKNLPGIIRRIRDKEIQKDASTYFHVEAEFTGQPDSIFRSGMTGKLLIIRPPM